MSGAQHTPGPWSASAPDGSYHDVIRIFADADAEGSLPVAVCPQRQSAIMSVLSGQNDATTEAAANARLIAAAPDLLEAHLAWEAAEDARNDCTDEEDGCDNEGPWEHCPLCSERFGRAIDLRHAAIAKARGA